MRTQLLECGLSSPPCPEAREPHRLGVVVPDDSVRLAVHRAQKRTLRVREFERERLLAFVDGIVEQRHLCEAWASDADADLEVAGASDLRAAPFGAAAVGIGGADACHVHRCVGPHSGSGSGFLRQLLDRLWLWRIGVLRLWLLLRLLLFGFWLRGLLLGLGRQGDAGVDALAFAGVVLGSYPDPVGGAGRELAEGGGRLARSDLAVLALAGVGVLDVRDVAVGRAARGRGLPGDDDLVALGCQLQADHRAGCLHRVCGLLLLWLWLLLFGGLLLWLWLLWLLLLLWLFGGVVVGGGDGFRLGACLGHVDAVGGHAAGTAGHDVQLGRAAVGREGEVGRCARGPHPRRAREGRRALARARVHALPAAPARRQRHARGPRRDLRPVRRHIGRERRAQRHRSRTGREREPGHGQRVALLVPRRVLFV